MVKIYSESAFQNAIEAAEQLSVDERMVLLDVLRQRIQQTNRQDHRTVGVGVGRNPSTTVGVLQLGSSQAA